MANLTSLPSQHTVKASGSTALSLLGGTLYQDALGVWHVTTAPSDATGHQAGYFTLSGSTLVIDTTLSSGYRTILTSTPSLRAYA